MNILPSEKVVLNNVLDSFLKKLYFILEYSQLSTGSSKKQESSIKTSISALLTMPKPLTMWIMINCGKF